VVSPLECFRQQFCINFSPLPCVLNAPSTYFDFVILTIGLFDEEYKLCRSSLYNCHHSSVTSSLLGRSPTVATRLRLDQEKKSTTLCSWRVVIASWSRWWEKRHYELKVPLVGDYKVVFSWSSRSRVASVWERPYIKVLSSAYTNAHSERIKRAKEVGILLGCGVKTLLKFRTFLVSDSSESQSMRCS
jgi:hypothetical protein